MLGWAMAEARLRRAPLQVVMAVAAPSAPAEQPHSSARAQLNRRIDRWTRRYPDVAIESVFVPDVRGGHGSSAEYLTGEGDSVQLLVSGTRDLRSLGRPGDAGRSSVLAVGGTRP